MVEKNENPENKKREQIKKKKMWKIETSQNSKISQPYISLGKTDGWEKWKFEKYGTMEKMTKWKALI